MRKQQSGLWPLFLFPLPDTLLLLPIIVIVEDQFGRIDGPVAEIQTPLSLRAMTQEKLNDMRSRLGGLRRFL